MHTVDTGNEVKGIKLFNTVHESERNEFIKLIKDTRGLSLSHIHTLKGSNGRNLEG